MNAIAALNRYAHWVGFALVVLLVCLVAYLAPARISQVQMEREAQTAADRIAAQLEEEPGYLLEALSEPALAPHLNEVFSELGYSPRVLRFELYGQDGKLLFTSGSSEVDLSPASVPAPSADAGGKKPAVAIFEGSGEENQPRLFATLNIPFKAGERPDARLVVYLDQTEQVAVLTKFFGLIAVITLILLIVSIATPMTFAMMRSRERRVAQEQVRFLENHDSLTGLPNRAAFSSRLMESLNQMHRNRSHIAVLCVDVDKFKEINDSIDHAGGDAVLREIAMRISTTLREGDIFGRLGGDEFAIALIDITNLADVMAFMNRLVEVMRAPFVFDGKELVCTTSVGIALAPSDGDSPNTILKHAAIALTRAKRDGGQRMCFFERSMDRALQRRRMVEHELRLAIGRDEFDVLYQPQISLDSEKACGSEALIRWHHPVHGKIAPAHFIAVAEDTGLIVPLGEWVLRRACMDAVKWPNELPVAVNLSPAQFRDTDIAKVVAEVLEETGLPPQRLELEITENLLINDTEEVLQKLKTLRSLGVAIAMDDFGTGYSSLSYLARFPFSKIKIDRQFIRSMTQDATVRAIVQTIIALGKALNMTITAEGVETTEQADMLREFGCPEVQGFLYSRPVSADEAGQLKSRITLRSLRKESSAA